MISSNPADLVCGYFLRLFCSGAELKFVGKALDKRLDMVYNIYDYFIL